MVTDSSPQKKAWSLTQDAFDKFLARLDPIRDRAGEQYELLRGKLILFFQCRDCPAPQEHADETLNRVVRKIDQGDEIRDPSTYVFGVARMLVLEILKERTRHQAALDRMQRLPVAQEPDDSQAEVDCLRRCLAALPPESRRLITLYYQGEKRAKIENRKLLAKTLNLPLNALRIRAFRLRERLQGCMDTCLEGERDSSTSEM